MFKNANYRKGAKKMVESKGERDAAASSAADNENREGRLLNVSLSDYLEQLASGAPTPGGGAASALAGAQGAALLVMVANLTIGKKKYLRVEQHNKETRARAAEQQAKLEAGIDEDKDAFAKVAEAYAMPRQTEEEKKVRADAIAEASVAAAEAPLRVMRAAYEAMKVARDMVGRSNPNLANDIYVGTLMLAAAIIGAKGNVDANTPYIRDRSVEQRIRRESDGLAASAEALQYLILYEIRR